MNKKYKITNEDLRRIDAHHRREERKQAGFFDGRFAPRTQPSGKVYKRNQKHKNFE